MQFGNDFLPVIGDRANNTPFHETLNRLLEKDFRIFRIFFEKKIGRSLHNEKSGA